MGQKSGNAAHDTAVTAAENQYQNVVGAAGVTRVQARAGDIARHQSIVASGLSNTINVENSRAALRELLGPSAA